MTTRTVLTPPIYLAGTAALALALAACAPTQSAGPETSPAPSATASAAHPHDHHPGHDDHDSPASEHTSPTPRLVMTYDGGLIVVDAATLEQVADLQLDGFNRLNSAGDGRHVAVSTSGGWAVLDAGTWAQAHGDHSHFYTSEPLLHDVIIEAHTPGHVVVHDGLATLFDDGTGQVTVVETSEWGDMASHGHAHTIREYTTDAPHHGVAAAATDGTMLVTRGDDTERTGAMLLDRADAVVALSDDCPGVHGETAFANSAGETVLLTGCEDGALVFHGDHIHKVTSPDAFGRIGNAFSVNGSDVVLGDYKADPDMGLGLSHISLIDVVAETITAVNPFGEEAAQYTWRGLARGADGEILVLGTDGALRVLDPVTGDLTATIEVINAWNVPDQWQTPHPALTVLEGMAYVTDPASGTVTSVDYVGGEVWNSASLGVAMNEIVGVPGADS